MGSTTERQNGVSMIFAPQRSVLRYSFLFFGYVADSTLDHFPGKSAALHETDLLGLFGRIVGRGAEFFPPYFEKTGGQALPFANSPNSIRP